MNFTDSGFNQAIIAELIKLGSQKQISIGILGSGYAASKLVDIILSAEKKDITIEWILQRKELNAIRQNINVISINKKITPVTVIINTELT